MNKLKQLIQQYISKNQPEKIVESIIFEANDLIKNLKSNYYIEAFSALPSIKKIEFSHKTETLSVVLDFDDKILLMINPKFISEYVTTPRCLLFLILHEFFHVIYGDLVSEIIKMDTSDRKIISNIVFDIIINRSIIEKFFNNNPPFIIKKLYNRINDPLSKLLFPPEVVFDNEFRKINNFILCCNPTKLIKKYIIRPAGIRNKKLKELIVDFYIKSWIESYSKTSPQYMFETLKEIFKLLGNKKIRIKKIIFIGSYHRNKDFIKKYLKKYFKKMYGLGEGLYREKIEPKEKYNKNEIQKVYTAILASLYDNFKKPIFTILPIPDHSVLPFPRRKDIFLLSAGVTPILYDNVYLKKDFDEKSVHLYIDVSGSTEDYWGFVYGLILKLKDLIRFPVYGFSTKVVPLELEDIKNGQVVTTSGTDFNCIVEHAVIKNFKKILIVTDGYSDFRHENAEILRTQIKPYVVFIASYPHDDEYKLAEVFFKHNILRPKDKNITWWFLPCEER